VDITVGEVAAHLTATGGQRPSARDIAAAISRMIHDGSVVVGARLPTVRDLARHLLVSPTTVSQAWRSLGDIGAIDARGRRGTFVSAPLGPGSPRRFRRVAALQLPGTTALRLDLSTGTPDPLLLPSLGAAVARVSRQPLTSSYLDRAVLPDLEEVLRSRWPFDAEALTVVDGAMDALDRVSRHVVRLGDRVVVETPTFPPLLDLLESLGADIVGVPLDDQGPRVDAMSAALQHAPVVALFLQPRAHNPTGVSRTKQRTAELGSLISAQTVQPWIVEDDHSGDIAAEPLHSLGVHLPHRTVHLLSFSKSHGPDLRLAAVGGADDVVTGIANRRLIGPGWSSRLLQAVLLEMLVDPAVRRHVGVARDTYRRRRDALARHLHAVGVGTGGNDGINLWVPVHDERDALISLAAHGIGAAPGEPFVVANVAGVEPENVPHRRGVLDTRDALPHIRVTAGLVDDVDAGLADALALAALGDRPSGRQHPGGR
jgi:DNA-binding transcriptional MocR family regulator